MQQQMAGRAGRRGLDTQGHLVYAGTTSNKIRDLMLAKVANIHGTEPRYHTQYLPHMLSSFMNPAFYSKQTEVLGGESLADHVSGREPSPNFNHISCKFLLEMDFIQECDVNSRE